MSKDKKRENGVYHLMARFQKLEGDKMFAHQRFAIEHIRDNPGKNLGIFYDPGTGKTSPAVLAALKSRAKTIVYMGPAALQSVFNHYVKIFGGDLKAKDKRGHPIYHTISANAGNIWKQWRKAVEPTLGEIPDYESTSAMGEGKMGDLGYPLPGNIKVFVIMDEAHLFSARVASILNKINYSKKEEDRRRYLKSEAYLVYRHLLWDDRIQVVALTGTPIQNKPFNFVPLCNILRREITGIDGRRSLALPETYGRFYESFIKDTLPSISEISKTMTFPQPKGVPHVDTDLLDNPENSKEIAESIDHARKLFHNRIKNLFIWFEVPKGMEEVPFPDVVEDVIEEIPMSDFQWQNYQRMDVEQKRIENLMRKYRGPSISDFLPSVEGESVYSTFTRQASNFAYDKDLWVRYRRSPKKIFELTPDSEFTMEGLKKRSCKLHAIFEKIYKNLDKIHGIFSHFVGPYGLKIAERALKLMGWLSLNEAISRGVDDYQSAMNYLKNPPEDLKVYPLYNKLKERRFFGNITGETRSKSNQIVKNILNNPKNPKDIVVGIILYSGAAGYGLTFKSGRMLHFLESLWDRNDYKQASDRWARINSAIYLSPENQTFISYRYIAVPPKSYNRMKIQEDDSSFIEETADEHILDLSKKKFMIVSRFLNWIKESAINCEGQFKAESKIHREIISKKKTPPRRTFFSCINCSDKYNKSFIVQKLTKIYHCDKIDPVYGKNIIKLPIVERKNDDLSGEYILDKETGLGWLHYTRDGKKWNDVMVKNSGLLREMWRLVLKKK